MATSIESLLKYPCGDKLTLLAKTSSSSSDFGSRPVHTRKFGLLGNGAFMVPLPEFLPSLIIHVFRKRAFLRFSYLESIDWSIYELREYRVGSYRRTVYGDPECTVPHRNCKKSWL